MGVVSLWFSMYHPGGNLFLEPSIHTNLVASEDPRSISYQKKDFRLGKLRWNQPRAEVPPWDPQKIQGFLRALVRSTSPVCLDVLCTNRFGPSAPYNVFQRNFQGVRAQEQQPFHWQSPGVTVANPSGKGARNKSSIGSRNRWPTRSRVDRGNPHSSQGFRPDWAYYTLQKERGKKLGDCCA